MQIAAIGINARIGDNNRNKTGISQPNVTIKQNQNPVSFKGWFEDMIFYIPNEMRNQRWKRKENQIEQVENSVHDDIRLIAERKGIPVEEARNQYNEIFDAVAIPLKKDGNEIGLNKIVGYAPEKYQIMKDLLIPLMYENTEKEKEYTVPNGILLYGPKNTGKTHFVKALGEHLKEKELAKFYIFEPGTMTEDDNGVELYAFFKESESRSGNWEKGDRRAVLFFDDMEKYLDPESHPEVTDTFLAITAECAKKGITWVGSTNHPEKLSPLLFKPYRLNSDILFDKTSDAEKSAVMSYMWRQKDRKDNTDHDKLIKKYNTSKFNFYPPEMQSVANMTDNYMEENVDKKRRVGFNYLVTEKMAVRDKYVEPQIVAYMRKIEDSTITQDNNEETISKNNYDDIRDEVKVRRFKFKDEKPIAKSKDD